MRGGFGGGLGTTTGAAGGVSATGGGTEGGVWQAASDKSSAAVTSRRQGPSVREHAHRRAIAAILESRIRHLHSPFA
jgi:nicotinamide mononucleotide (NMN) deamidase PncC